MKQKENIECKILINKAVALYLRRRSRRLRRAGGGILSNNQIFFSNAFDLAIFFVHLGLKK